MEAGLAASLWGMREGRGERRGFVSLQGRWRFSSSNSFRAKREEVQNEGGGSSEAKKEDDGEMGEMGALVFFGKAKGKK